MLTEQEKTQYKLLQSSPLVFVERVWGLTPQPVKEEHLPELLRISSLTHNEWEEQKHLITAEWFGNFNEETNQWEWPTFERGKHITWQQYLIFLSFEKALHSQAQKTISVASGKGIGKSATLSMLLIYFLFAYPDCQIPCTAPGFQQLYDVLWKEIALWLQRMPPNLRSMYQWESSHVRIAESPASWFARAKTASKESPEALSGVHADYVLAIIDEASGVDDPIFDAAQGIFSSPNPFLIMISNPTKRSGYFFRSHHSNKDQWQCLQFSSQESPIVDHELVVRYSEDGTDTDKFRVSVLGQFPKEDVIDGHSYMQLITESSIRMEPLPAQMKWQDPILGVDPAGEGRDKTALTLRDNFFAQVIATEAISNAKSVTALIINACDKFFIRNAKNIVIDGFGPGGEVSKELVIAKGWNSTSVNVRDKPDDEDDQDLYINKKAEMYWKLKQWLERGGILINNPELKAELLTIKFRRTEAGGKIQIMSKREMSALGLRSPDLAESLALTMLRKPGTSNIAARQEQVNQAQPYNRWGI
jgi:hypothetical protein